MLVKITNKDGKYSIVDRRENENIYGEGIVSFISSTEEQPFIAINFTHKGKAVGGRTMTEIAIKNMIAKAKQLGMIVEGTI